jgi:hypothetical protein
MDIILMFVASIAATLTVIIKINQHYTEKFKNK